MTRKRKILKFAHVNELRFTVTSEKRSDYIAHIIEITSEADNLLQHKDFIDFFMRCVARDDLKDGEYIVKDIRRESIRNYFGEYDRYWRCGEITKIKNKRAK